MIMLFYILDRYIHGKQRYSKMKQLSLRQPTVMQVQNTSKLFLNHYENMGFASVRV